MKTGRRIDQGHWTATNFDYPYSYGVCDFTFDIPCGVAFVRSWESHLPATEKAQMHHVTPASVSEALTRRRVAPCPHMVVHYACLGLETSWSELTARHLVGRLATLIHLIPAWIKSFIAGVYSHFVV